jgi:hypothetical protein
VTFPSQRIVAMTRKIEVCSASDRPMTFIAVFAMK